jgi:hypothetical protein
MFLSLTFPVWVSFRKADISGLGRAVDLNTFRPEKALHSKTWHEYCLLGCMLSAGREVKMEIPICTRHFNGKRALCPLRLISRN